MRGELENGTGDTDHHLQPPTIFYALLILLVVTHLLYPLAIVIT